MPDRFQKKRAQIRDRGIGVCIRLKIGDKFAAFCFSCQFLLTGCNLFTYREQMIFSKITGATAAAEDTAAGSLGRVYSAGLCEYELA